MADLGEGPKAGLGSPLFWVKIKSCRRKKSNKKPGPPPPPLTQGLDLLLIWYGKISPVPDFH